MGFVAPIEPNEFMLGTDYLEWRANQTPFESFTSMQPGVADCDLADQNPVRLTCAHAESSFDWLDLGVAGAMGDLPPLRVLDLDFAEHEKPARIHDSGAREEIAGL